MVVENFVFSGERKNPGEGKVFYVIIEQRKLPPPLIFTGGEYLSYFPEGKRLAGEFLDLRELPDGVFVYNDLLAVALFSELSEKGIRCPDDIAIVSCDNTEICLYPYPALTSIDINVSSVAKIALEKMIDFIKGEPIEPLHTKAAVKLVVRGSTKRLKKPA